MTNRNYVDTLVPLFVESALIGVLVNLVSAYAEGWLVKNQVPLDGSTLALLLFLLLAVLALYALFQTRVRNMQSYQPQKPTELGSMLSLVFFAQLLLLDCSQLVEFNRWMLLGAGATPFLIGTGMSAYLDDKFHELKRKFDQQRQEVQAQQEAEKKAGQEAELKSANPSEPPASAKPYEGEAKRISRVHIRAAIEGDLDVEEQPGILVIIIESILAVKKTVSQLEIFEVCRAITKKLPPANIFELICDLMEIFVYSRENTRKVKLITDNPRDWKIEETKPWQ